MMSESMLPTPPGASTSPEVQASKPRTFWVKRASNTMLEKNPIIMTSMIRLLAAKLRSAYTLRSRMGSTVVSSRRKKPARATTATTASATMNAESNHSLRSPWSRNSWRVRKPMAIRTSPSTSTRRGFLRYGGSNSTALETRKPTHPMGTLM